MKYFILASIIAFSIGIVEIEESFADSTILMANNAENPVCEPNCFIPNVAYVAVGEPVTFVNSKPSPTMISSGHPSNGPDGVFDSGTIKPGFSYTVTFTKPGTYPYFDLISPWMQGIISVGDNSVSDEYVSVDAGIDQIVVEGDTVLLSGDSENSKDNDLKYSWKQISGTPVKFSGSSCIVCAYNQKNASFIAPEIYVTTPLVFQVTSTDNKLQKTTDTVRVTVLDNVTNPTENYPTAIAGDDIVTNSGLIVTLNGMKSYDDEEKNLKYSWNKVNSFRNYAKIPIDHAQHPVATFTAPIVDKDTTFTFQLTVNNGKKIDIDSIKVTVKSDKAEILENVAKEMFGDEVTVDITYNLGNYGHCMPECFEPDTIIIGTGTTVHFTNNDGYENHTIRHGNPHDDFQGLFASEMILPGDSFSYTFTEPGIYNYFCGLHAHPRGTIIVK